MTLKKRIIDFFHMINEYIDFKLDSMREVDFVGDTKEEILANYDMWINENRFRREYHRKNSR